MSLLHYFKPISTLPTPEETGIGEAATKQANKAVQRVLESEEPPPKQRKYTTYSDEQRAEVGKYAAENGNAAALRKFKAEIPNLGESTVRFFKKRYLDELRVSPGVPVTTIASRKRGRPLTLGEIDEEVQKFIRALRKAGTAINTAVILAAAEVIVTSRDRTLLAEHGGHIRLTKSWAASLMERMKLVKRRGSTQMKTALTETVFKEVKAKFHSRVQEVTGKHQVLPQIIINWDQTGINVVPASTWTMEEQGSKRVPIAGFGDKRQITITVGVSMSGEMLPLQILYAGKSERCHPAYSFPPDFAIWHTPNHWANGNTTVRYINTIIVPYVNSVRERMELAPNHPAIVMFDSFRGHKGNEVEDVLKENFLIPVPIPSNCTDRLQPVDVSVNKPLKDHLRNSFTKWYASQVQEQLQEGTRIEEVKVDLRLSVMKELEAKWLVSAYHYLKSTKTIIQNGFKEVGVTDAIEGQSGQSALDEDPFADID